MRPDAWLAETRRALRSLARAPGFSAIVIATLALGLGAVALVVGVFSPYFLRPLPFAEPDRLLHLGHVDPESGWDLARFSAPQVRDLEATVASFDGLGAYYYGTVNVVGEGAGVPEPERVTASWVDPELFAVLGTPAARGRGLSSDDRDQRVVVVGHGLWQGRWAGDPGILGRTVLLDDVAHTVVGVMPAAFSFPFNEVRMWLPLDRAEFEDRDATGLLVVGRLADDADPASARAELATLHAALAAEHPEVDGRFSGIVAKEMRESLNFAWEPLRISFVVLLGAVAALLLLACVNVANLVLARGMARRGELAVRAALGGGRADLVRPMVLESVLLAAAGGLAGLLLARTGLRLLAPLVPDALYRVGDPGLDAAAVRTAAVALLAAPLLFGLLPAWTTSRSALAATLRDGGRGGGGREGARGRRALVVAQVTLAVVLVAGAGLMARSLAALQDVDLGFAAPSVLTVEITPPESRYPDGPTLDTYYTRAAEELAALPGVRAVGATSRLPLNHETFLVRVAATGTESAPDGWPQGLIGRASGEYFGAMGIPLLRGRAFRPADAGGDGVVVSRDLAERLWPEADAVGRTLQWEAGDGPRTGRVLGVVGRVRYDRLTGPAPGQVYLPLEGAGSRRRFVTLSVTGDPAASAAAVREALRRIDPALPVTVRPMPEIVRESALQWSVSSVFLAAFGGLALVLAALGVYGVVSWSVRRRRREIGIRMALGAARDRIVTLVLREGLAMVGVGVALGLAAVAALSPVLGSVLYGVQALDPGTLVGVVLLLALVAVGASFLPARQASGLEPARVLREE